MASGAFWEDGEEEGAGGDEEEDVSLIPGSRLA